MNRIDLRILDTLQHDGRLSNQALADQVGISAAACWRRVRALEEEGLIKGYAALLDRDKLDLKLCAFIHVSLSRHSRDSAKTIEQAAAERPEVLECFATTGDADFILRVVTSDIQALDVFLDEFLAGLPQIVQVRSNVALREVKLTTQLPLNT